MAKRRPRPPLSAREIAAWRSGRRLRVYGQALADLAVAEPELLLAWLTPAELTAWRLWDAESWWQWWWAGWSSPPEEGT